VNKTDEAIKTIAEWCIRKGISIIPIGEDKKPAIKWGECIDNPLTEWDYPGCNIACITGETNGLVVVDCDSREGWLEWEAKMPPTPLRVKTRRGMHYYYRHPGEYVKSGSHLKLPDKEFEHDIKGDRSYVLFPGSIRGGRQYTVWPTQDNPEARWINPSRLPLFSMEWRPDMTSVDNWSSKKVINLQAYMSSIRAVAGQGGDATTYRLCKILRENEVDQVEAMALISEWNRTNCDPPWSARDLMHKLRGAYDN
jgi:hypothetical protein